MKKTINQIRVELSKLSLAHAQINSFFWGDFLRAYKERELDYPLSCCYYPTAQMYTNQTEIPITIIICDKIYKDWSNLNDVESDTLKICRDLFNVINMSQTWQLLGRVQSCTVTKFVERGGDEVAGHQMQINFRLRDKSGICDLPIFGYDFDQDFTTGCEPVLIFKDGLLIDTVPSGGIYEYFSDVCLDATVENSNQSYTDTVASGGTLVLPDITVTDSDGSTYTQPSVLDVTCSPALDATVNINGIEVGTAPSGGTLDLNLIDQNSNEVPFVQVGNDLVVNTGSSYENETITYLTSIEISNDNTVYYPGTAQEILGSEIWDAVDSFFKSAKAQSWYAKCDTIHPYIGGTALKHSINAINPILYQETYLGGWTHNALGITGNGVNSTAETGYVPLVKQLVGGSVSIYSRSADAGTYYDIATDNVSELLAIRWTDHNLYARLTTSSVLRSAVNNDARGLYTMTWNVASGSFKVFKNTSEIISASEVITEYSSNQYYVGSWGAGDFSARNYSFRAMFNDILTNLEINSYKTIVQSLQTALKREV